MPTFLRLRELRKRVRHERACRAEARQRAYQTDKAIRLADCRPEMTASLIAYATSIRNRIETVRPIDPNARLLEVGSGAHGLIFFMGFANAVGVDPLADVYSSLFPEWQRRARTLRGYGEALPFPDASFDLVLSDNVIDHAEQPEAILREVARVLRPGGTLYLTVHVHHIVYAVAARLHTAWNVLGLRFEIDAFADHTTHMTLKGIRESIASLPFRVLREDTGIDAAKKEARSSAPRHLGDRLKRLFFKNARFEIIAERT
jgi:SAM-dependent methyltransferase